jgi:hypothetical protein
MRHNYLGRVSAAGCCLVLLAGCGSSASKTTTSASGTQTPSSSSPAASNSASPASLAQLNKIVLQPSDLPQGWKGTPHKADPSDAAAQAAVVKCVGARDTDSDKVADTDSEDFALDQASISSSATSYRSQSDIDADIAFVHSPKLSGCYTALVKKELGTSLPGGATIESATIKITPGSAGGPANVVATGSGTITVNANGQQVAVYLSVAFITGPLIEAELDAENIGAPVPAALFKSLVATVAARAGKA